MDTNPVPKKLGSITPSPLHGKGGSGHVSRSRGIKVRQSWTLMGNCRAISGLDGAQGAPVCAVRTEM